MREQTLSGTALRANGLAAYPAPVGVGPAFLIYYSPAFLRTALRTNGLAGLQMLADVYRQARALWPLTAEQAEMSVTVRIDQIKELSPEVIMDGHAWGKAWVLVKQNGQEALVQQHPLYSVAGRTLDDLREQIGHTDARLLAFWWHDTDDDDEAPEDEPDSASFVAELTRLRDKGKDPRRSSSLWSSSSSLTA